MKEIIKLLAKKQTEFIYVFDHNELIIFFEGDIVSLEIENKYLLNSTNIILVHNHPNGTPFSISDIINLIQFDCMEMILVTENFIYHVIRPKEGWGIKVESIENEIKKYDNWANEEIDKLISRNILTFKEATIEKNHYIWIVYFQKYNISYYRKTHENFFR